MEQVMQQHLERDIKFLTGELSVTDEQTASHRVFFVSAKEVLHYRLRKHQRSADPGQGLAPGYRARLQNFEQFERRFKECLSSSAIHTKFEQHHKQGQTVVGELSQLLANQDSLLRQRREEVRIELGACQSRAQQLAQNKPSLVASGDHLVSMAMGQVGSFQSKALRDLLTQLPSLVDLYQAPLTPVTPPPTRRDFYLISKSSCRQSYKEQVQLLWSPSMKRPRPSLLIPTRSCCRCLVRSWRD
jgi:mitofusin